MQGKFNSSLYRVLPKRKPKLVVAYNFNIAETNTHYIVDLIGAREYSADNEDWACDESWTCRPSDFKIAKKACGDWIAALKTVNRLATSFLETDKTLLNDAEAVTVGFVDGNLERVWPTEA